MKVIFLLFVAINVFASDKVDIFVDVNKNTMDKSIASILGEDLKDIYVHKSTLKDTLLPKKEKIEVKRFKFVQPKKEKVIEKSIVKEDFFIMYSNINNLNIKNKPEPFATIMQVLQRGEEIKLEYCKKGWCKLYKQNLYVGEYLLSKENRVK